jgi:hypothetical protein
MCGDLIQDKIGIQYFTDQFSARTGGTDTQYNRGPSMPGHKCFQRFHNAKNSLNGSPGGIGIVSYQGQVVAVADNGLCAGGTNVIPQINTIWSFLFRVFEQLNFNLFFISPDAGAMIPSFGFAEIGILAE